MAVISAGDAERRLASLPGWGTDNGELVKTFGFRDFREALAFVNRVGEAAESAGHHPDIDIRYNQVRLSLVTHDAGGLTEKDFDLASRVNTLCDKAGRAVRATRLLLAEVDCLVVMVRDPRTDLGRSFSKICLLVNVEPFLGAGCALRSMQTLKATCAGWCVPGRGRNGSCRGAGKPRC